MPASDVPDLNVWLALADPDHQHHARARRYWETEALAELAFCRVTMLGLLRLLTHPKVMRGRPFTSAEAWEGYRTFRALPEVIFLPETRRVEAHFAQLTDNASFTPHRWTDAWLAAHALTSGLRLVSFDGDFHNFAGLPFLHLKADL